MKSPIATVIVKMVSEHMARLSISTLKRVPYEKPNMVELTWFMVHQINLAHPHRISVQGCVLGP